MPLSFWNTRNRYVPKSLRTNDLLHAERRVFHSFGLRVLRLSRFLALALTLAGLLGALGVVGPWSLARDFLAHNTKPDSVLCFFLGGLALLCGPLAAPRGWKRALSAGCRVGVLAIAIGRLMANLFPGHDLERLPTSLAWLFPTGTMAPQTAAALVFDATALALLNQGGRRIVASQLLGLAGFSIGFFGLMGHLLHAQAFISVFSGGNLRPLTIVGLLTLSIATITARPQRGIVAVLLRNDPAGIVARRLFAPAVLAPIAIGWIAYNGWRTNYYDAGFACSLIVVGSIGIICTVTVGSVLALNRTERERRRLAEAQMTNQGRVRGAREAYRLKADFVANVSHELRTPMNGVLGMTNLLLGSDLTREQRDQAETIRQSGDALLTLVNEILDFSKVEAGKVELEAKPFSVHAWADEVVALLSTAARRGRINLVAHVARGTPPTLVGDMPRLRQVLINLVGNALKFTDEGEVLVRVAATQRRDHRHDLHLEVTDSGIGISAAALAVIFHPFEQGDNSATRRFGGTGLGLAICQRLSELMGGTIGVTSEVGQGTTFRFSVPLEVAPQEIVPQADPLPENSSLVLVSPPGRYTHELREVLQAWGAEVVLMDDPLARTLLAPCAAVLLDRGADALGLAARMQLDPMWKSVPRILLSFDESLADEEAALFSKHLLKPLKRSHLAAALRDLGGIADLRVRPVATQPLMAITHPLRVLLAEDNFINQKVAVALLARLGYRADVAANGAEAVECVLRQPYDLVFLDIQMPQMDGVEACLTMRRKLRGRCPRLVALTANAFPGAREQYIEKGFDDYLSKPLLPETLLRVLTATSSPEPPPAPSTRLLVPAARAESNEER